MDLPRQIRRKGECAGNVGFGRIIRRIRIAETLGKNLIPNGILGPIGHELACLHGFLGPERAGRGDKDQNRGAETHFIARPAWLGRPAATSRR